MKENNDILKKGVIIDSFCGYKFKVQLEEGVSVTATLAGSLRKYTKVMRGDEVMVRLSPYNGFEEGMICERLTKVPVVNVVHKKKRSQMNKKH